MQPLYRRTFLREEGGQKFCDNFVIILACSRKHQPAVRDLEVRDGDAQANIYRHRMRTEWHTEQEGQDCEYRPCVPDMCMTEICEQLLYSAVIRVTSQDVHDHAY
jgi:hypothetical protein